MEIYLDNCATTRVCDEAVQACIKAMTLDYGNPSSLHKKGLDAEEILRETRRTAAGILSCDANQLIITGSATESNNLAVLGAAAAYPRAGKTIVTTTVEHASVTNAIRHLAENGYKIRQVSPRPDGNFNPQDFLDAVDEDTFLLSMMMVNNEIGTILPWQTVIPTLRKKFPKLLIHMDAVQGFAKYPLNVKRLDLDLLSLSGHKIYAPKGIGMLYCKKGIRLKPIVFGGGQENGLRSGTQAVQLAAGLTEAIRLCQQNRTAFEAHYRMLNARLRDRIAKMDRVCINSPENGAPHLLNISVIGVPSEIMLHFLESRGIFVSSGSACSKGAQSEVLKAYGFPEDRIRSALRISFSKDNTPEEIDLFADTLAEGAARFRRMTGA